MSRTVQAWRLVKKNRAEEAFDGEGAFRFGGHWNNRGQRVVYASSTLALALLEILVHIDPTARVPEMIAIPIDLPNELIERGDYSSLNHLSGGLPWQLSETRRAGDAWAKSKASAAFQVPSAIIPLEHNFLINPDHPDFDQCRIGALENLPFDSRLLQT